MLLHRIAYDWGIPVWCLLEQHTSAEITELFAYLRIEPHGYEIENFRAGIVAATVANVAPRKRGSKPLRPQDFYPAKSKRSLLSPRQERQLQAKRQREAQRKKP